MHSRALLRHPSIRCVMNVWLLAFPDLPTFYEIKAEDLPPFGKKSGRFFCSENIAIFLSAGDTE